MNILETILLQFQDTVSSERFQKAIRENELNFSTIAIESLDGKYDAIKQQLDNFLNMLSTPKAITFEQDVNKVLCFIGIVATSYSEFMRKEETALEREGAEDEMLKVEALLNNLGSVMKYVAKTWREEDYYAELRINSGIGVLRGYNLPCN